MGFGGVAAWSEPLFEAFEAGLWRLIWTKECVFWVAKPSVSVERVRGFDRPHREDGPALASDIENLYFLHGVMVPAHVVLAPSTITHEEITHEGNAEVRRIMIERVGWPRYLAESGAEPIDTRENEIENCNSEALFQASDGSRVLVCRCPSTARVYAMRVPREMSTCEQAQAWLAGSRPIRLVGRT
jgi:hypothetical protein